MSEIIKKICVGEDTKTLVLKIHGDLGSLKVNSCDNCNKKDSSGDSCSKQPISDDSGAAKEADKDSSKAKESDKDSGAAKEADKDSSKAKESDKDSGKAKESDKDSGKAKEADKDSGKAKEADKDSGKAKEADKDSGKAKEEIAPVSNISLLSLNGMYTDFWFVNTIKDGYLASGNAGSYGLLVEMDHNLNFTKKVRTDASNPCIREVIKSDESYISSLEYGNGGAFLAWDSNYKTIGGYRIYHNASNGNVRYYAIDLHKVEQSFLGEIEYIASYDTRGHGNIVVAFDKNYKKIKFVSTPGKSNINTLIYKDKIVGISTIDNKGYIFVTDSNLTITKQIVYTVKSDIFSFKRIVKTDTGYLVLGDLDKVNGIGKLLLLKLDEDFNILDKKVIGSPFLYAMLDFKKRPDGGYLISGGTALRESNRYGVALAIDENLNIENSISLNGSAYEVFLKGLQAKDGTYLFVGHTDSVGNGKDAYIASFKGDFRKFNNQKMAKYPRLVINSDLDFKVHDNVSIEVNYNADYVPNYEKLYSGHELKFDSIKNDGTVV